MDFNNHKTLFRGALLMYILLSLFVSIIPAMNNQQMNAPLPSSKALTAQEMRGKLLYIDNGCVACHTQQVRDADMDKVWGDRPGVAADYARMKRTDFWRNTATLMGTERTGPDLADVGNRRSSQQWNLIHLYNPRAVVESSIMPSYKWLFDVDKNPDTSAVIIQVPEEFREGLNGKIVASQKALDLVAYLQSLKQAPLPTGVKPKEFLYQKEIKEVATSSNVEGEGALPDGSKLYAANCAACHQPNGAGLPGAFPPLKGSKIVLDENIQTYIDIILHGYNAHENYGVMPPVAETNNLSAADITAIMNHERTSWGNDAKKVTLEEVKVMIEKVKKLAGDE